MLYSVIILCFGGCIAFSTSKLLSVGIEIFYGLLTHNNANTLVGMLINFMRLSETTIPVKNKVPQSFTNFAGLSESLGKWSEGGSNP